MGRLDAYELRARVAPALIISLPGIITLLFIGTSLSASLAQFLSSGVVLLVVVYAISFLVRNLGRREERKLIEDWGELPSTRFVRWRDEKFAYENKKAIHSKVAQNFQINLLSQEQELEYQEAADTQIKEAFRRVRPLLRHDNPEALSSKHNAEYGFHRNLLGSRPLWVASAFIGTLACGITWHAQGTQLAFLAAALNSAVLVWSIVWCLLLPSFTKDAADSYAESAWMEFLSIGQEAEGSETN